MPLNADGSFNRGELEARINSKTKLILVNSPSNPLGTVSGRDELEYLCSLGVSVISDEVYEAFCFGSPYVSSCEVSDETFIVGSLSKSFALAGLRLGYLVLPASENPYDIWNIKACVNFCTGIATQRIGLHLMRQADAVFGAHSAYLARNRQLLFDTCERLGLRLLFPDPAGFFALVDTSQLDRPVLEVARDLVAEHRLGIMPANDFGPDAGSFIRINFAAAEQDVVEALTRIQRYMSARL